MFNYSYLETLHAVETAGTYAKAARTRGVSRSAVAQNIQMLEDRWGSATLAVKPVRPTRLGYRLCRHVDQVRLLETRLMLEQGHMFDVSEIDPVPVTMLVDRSAVPSGIHDVISVISDQVQSFMFQSDLCASSQLGSELASGTIKTAVSTQWITKPEFLGHTLGTETFFAVASPGYFKHHFENGVDKKSLSTSVSVAYSSETNYCSDFIRQTYGGEANTKTNYLPANYGMINACLQGKVWAVLPRSLVAGHLQAGRLVDLVPGKYLKVDLYWYANRFIATLLPEITNTVLNVARETLLPSRTY